MATPTVVRVEAIGQTQTVLRWTYSGTVAVEVYRSSDGVIYDPIVVVPAATKIYNDTGLESGTKYWYKVSTDNGVTFSSIVTVVTHNCGDDTLTKEFTLPRFTSQDTTDPGFHQKLGKAMREIEDVIHRNVFFQEPCDVCIVDKAITINCADGCDCYNVDASTDINSISFVNCDGIDPCIHFQVPPNTTTGICGFPRGHTSHTQFGGDECTQAPIVGGATGRTVSTGAKDGGESKPGSGKGGGSGGGGATCQCISGKTGELTVQCCSANCSMDCGSTKSLDILICGGVGPYTISGSSGLGFKRSNGVAVGVSDAIQKDQRITITPPANTGSAGAVAAYDVVSYCCILCPTPTAGACTLHGVCGHVIYDCNDNVNTACTSSGILCSPGTPAITEMMCSTHVPVNPCLPACSPATFPTCNTGVKRTCDARSAPTIALGCNPCGITTLSKTFTVTDAQGVSVVTTLTA